MKNTRYSQHLPYLTVFLVSLIPQLKIAVSNEYSGIGTRLLKHSVTKWTHYILTLRRKVDLLSEGVADTILVLCFKARHHCRNRENKDIIVRPIRSLDRRKGQCLNVDMTMTSWTAGMVVTSFCVCVHVSGCTVGWLHFRVRKLYDSIWYRFWRDL